MTTKEILLISFENKKRIYSQCFKNYHQSVTVSKHAKFTVTSEPFLTC